MSREELNKYLKEDLVYSDAVRYVQCSNYGGAEPLFIAGLSNSLKHYEAGQLLRDIPEAYAGELRELEARFEQFGDWEKVKTAAESLMDAEKRLYCHDVPMQNIACNKNEYWLDSLRLLAQAELHLNHPKKAEALYKQAIDFLNPQLDKKELPPDKWGAWMGPPPSLVSFKYAICRDYEALLRTEKRNDEADVLHGKANVFLFPERYP